MNTPQNTKLQSIFDAGVAHHQAGRLAEAERAYDEVLAADPDHAGALNLLGMVRLQAGEIDRAVELIGRAVARQPDYAQAHNNLGNALKSLGRTDEAAASYRRAIEIAPALAQAHHNLGVLVAGQGQLDDAAAHYRCALDIAPDYTEAHYNLATLRRTQGRTEDAIAGYRRATELDPILTEAHMRLARALHGEGDIDGAMASYGRVLDIDPDNAGAHHWLGNACWTRGEVDDALAHHRRAAELDPESREIHIDLSATLKKAGQRAESRAVLEAALRRDPLVFIGCTRPGKPLATILKLAGLQSVYMTFVDGAPAIVDSQLQTSFLIDRKKFATQEFYMLETNLLGAADLPPFDIILNGIVEPDMQPASLDVAEAFIARQSAPYINDPRRVRLTTRDRVCELLSGIENLVVPKVVRVRLPAADSSHFMTAVERHGLRFPLIVRPAGGHIGQGMTKVDNAQELAKLEAIPFVSGYYLIEFHDFQGDDGYYRKMRILFVDGKPYPVHHLISNQWNIHASARHEFMKHNVWMADEENSFLVGPRRDQSQDRARLFRRRLRVASERQAPVVRGERRHEGDH